MYFQIFNNDDNDLANYQCIDGVYILNDDISKSKFFFTNEEFLFDFLSDVIYVRKIILPTDNPNLKIIRGPIGTCGQNTWRSNLIILGKPRLMSDIRTFKFLSLNGVKFNHIPLKWASKNGLIQIVQFLLENGVNSPDQINHAFKIASKYGYLPVVKFLLDYGADVNVNDATDVNDIRTALSNDAHVGNGGRGPAGGNPRDRQRAF